MRARGGATCGRRTPSRCFASTWRPPTRLHARRTPPKCWRSSAATRKRRYMALDPKLLDILACPEDKGPLLYFADEAVLYNPRLKRRYDVKDDIPIMLIDEATAVDDAEHERLIAKAEADGVKPTFEA